MATALARCGSRVPYARAFGEYAGIILIPSSWSARPSCVTWFSSTLPPVLGVTKKWLTRSLISGRFPGLYLVITGTPAFFDGPQGVQKLPQLAQRLHADFGSNPRFDNPRAPQVRLRNFDLRELVEVGRKVRNLYADGIPNGGHIHTITDDAYLELLAKALAGRLGGHEGLAPRTSSSPGALSSGKR